MKTYNLKIAVSILCLCLTCSFAAAQQPDRSKPPQLGQPPVLTLPPIQHLMLSNGLPVVLLEKHELPLVEMELIVMAGSAMDPAGKSGLASIASALMEEGAGTRNALELADAIDFLGASIEPYAGQHTSGVSLHTPLTKLDSALALFADMALKPQFPAQELDRQRKERLTTLIQWHDEPRSIASVEFNRVLYGTAHPYGVPTIGDEKTLRAFRADDLKEFHEIYFHPNNSTLVLVGDVTPGVILPKLEKALGEWKPAAVPRTSWPPISQVQERKIYLVDKPGAAQSEIRIGRIGVERLTEDYYALLVLNTILGGSFTSRLNMNLREQHGYTYGAGSRFDFRPLAGPFVASAAVQTNVTDSALAEFMKELNNILQPVADAELTRAKNYLTLRYPENFQSVAQIANELAELVVYKLPDNYLSGYTRHILEVTKEDVQRVAKKYIDPEKTAIVIVGDKAQVEKGISDLHLGPIQEMTVNEVLGSVPVLDEGK